MARHRAPETVGHDPSPDRPGDEEDQPTQRIERVPSDVAGPAGAGDPPRSEPGGWAVAPATYRLPELPARAAPVPAAPPADRPVPPPVYRAVPVPAAPPVRPPAGRPPGEVRPGAVPPAAVRPGAAPPAEVPLGAVPPVPGPSPTGGLDDSTGTFTRVLLTGLGGEADPAPPAAVLPPREPPRRPPTTAGERMLAALRDGRDAAVATTRGLGARLAALRGDERTAMLAVGAVVGMVVLLIMVLLVIARLTSDDDTAAASPRPATTAAAAAPTASTEPSPTGSPLPPAGGSFAVRHSGYCLAAPAGRTDAGAQLVQRTCGADPATGFHLVAEPGRADAYSLVDAGTGWCADVYGAVDGDGATVVQWECNGGDNQAFGLRALPDADGYLQIVAEHSGKCLEVTGVSRDEGAPIQQYECRDPAAEAAVGNQSWRLIPG